MSVSFIVLSAIALDFVLGEPHRGHPLVGFGRYASWLEKRLLDGASTQALLRNRPILCGALAWLAGVVPLTLLVYALAQIPYFGTVLEILVLYTCIAAQSLDRHAVAVLRALENGDLALARRRVGLMVSRDTGHADALAVRRAAIESVLENGSDAVFAPLFWFVVTGPAGAVLYRLANTLDAMWGYRNTRYRRFGRAAARIDDVLNWMPARLTAVSYAVLGRTRTALSCWRSQAGLLSSPNGGPVMTAGAGALNLRLGGPARYHGQLRQKAYFGGSENPVDADIVRAVRLMYRTLILWAVLIAMGDALA
ncbi:MAG: adenosylcobinamide-phosphate synthase CbiB [Gammaproteobacteria bacterium]